MSSSSSEPGVKEAALSASRTSSRFDWLALWALAVHSDNEPVRESEKFVAKLSSEHADRELARVISSLVSGSHSLASKVMKVELLLGHAAQQQGGQLVD